MRRLSDALHPPLIRRQRTIYKILFTHHALMQRICGIHLQNVAKRWRQRVQQRTLSALEKKLLNLKFALQLWKDRLPSRSWRFPDRPSPLPVERAPFTRALAGVDIPSRHQGKKATSAGNSSMPPRARYRSRREWPGFMCAMAHRVGAPGRAGTGSSSVLGADCGRRPGLWLRGSGGARKGASNEVHGPPRNRLETGPDAGRLLNT